MGHLDFGFHNLFRIIIDKDKIKFDFKNYKHRFTYDRNLDQMLIEELDKFFKKNKINANSLNSFKIKTFLDKNHSSLRIIKVTLDAIMVAKPYKSA